MNLARPGTTANRDRQHAKQTSTHPSEIRGGLGGKAPTPNDRNNELYRNRRDRSGWVTLSTRNSPSPRLIQGIGVGTPQVSARVGRAPWRVLRFGGQCVCLPASAMDSRTLARRPSSKSSIVGAAACSSFRDVYFSKSPRVIARPAPPSFSDGSSRVAADARPAADGSPTGCV